jgi:hypothetical protein
MAPRSALRTLIGAGVVGTVVALGPAACGTSAPTAADTAGSARGTGGTGQSGAGSVSGTVTVLAAA